MKQTSLSLSNPFTLPVTVQLSGVVSLLTALIDSGLAGNFMDVETTTWLNVPIQCLSSPPRIHAIDWGPTGEGIIILCNVPLLFQITVTTKHPIILGFPWMHLHNPQISWRRREITQWSDYCHQHCLQLHSSAQHAHQWRAWNSLYPYPFPLSTKTFSKTSSAKPMVYPRTIPMIVILNYFQKECLPVTGYTPFPSMNKKLQSNIYKKHCNRGTFTRPCLLLLLGSFLWIKKGGLQPRIDYRGLNQITVKYHCPLPLGPAALE